MNTENTEAYDSGVSKDDEIVVSDLDIALYRVLGGGIDYISQLSAIRDLLQRNRQADLLLGDQIKKIDEFAKRATDDIINQHAIDEWIDHLNASVYQDAAHSMAAVGMLAPLVEAILYQSFSGIGRVLGADMSRFASHPRWQHSTKQLWDCHFFYEKSGKRSKNLVEGVFQLAEAVGLSTHLPENLDLKRTLEALFEYRNKMFHGGFEWPSDERRRFHKRIKNWPPDWFDMAMQFDMDTQKDEPWIFYLTDKFIADCLATLDGFLCGVGAFVRNE